MPDGLGFVIFWIFFSHDHLHFRVLQLLLSENWLDLTGALVILVDGVAGQTDRLFELLPIMHTQSIY
jgi:hypothetical protein